ncbi:MAG: DUF1566 domain-containing protein [Anaerolineaceae bacterium]|nr:DUF1566 domain-containing protein [Anaerolineaceae bacterium]
MKTKIFSLLIVLTLLLSSCASAMNTTQSNTDIGNDNSTALADEAAAAPVIEQESNTDDGTSDSDVSPSLTYAIVDTGQGTCYDDSSVIACPASSESFYGQDAQYTGNEPSYTNNGDGTIMDNVTGLIWQQSADTDGDGDIDANDKMSYDSAVNYCENLSYANQDDWQLPTIKQLFSLIDFSGVDPSGYEDTDTSGLIPFIDTDYFDFSYGDTSANERIIDSQYASSTLYVGDEEYLFGVNFADGRIKGYGLSLRGREKTFDVACVRANNTYGVNNFSNNGDSTITDNASGLIWAQEDSGSDAPNGLNWEEALAYVETQNAANYLSYSDWRLPNVKELQSIVDYSRSPDTTNSAAIDPLFNTTPITNEAGETDYSFYWSSTTHANWTNQSGSAGAYVSFGSAMGYMDNTWMDVHGAGAQRSDPKAGNPDEFSTGRGPQGDAIRIYNFVRLVRGGEVSETPAGDPTARSMSTNTESADERISDPQVAQDAPADRTGAPGDRPAAGQPAGPDGQPMPDLAAAATTLGITEEALKAALGGPNQGPPDFASVAQTLGVTEAELIAALGVPQL